MNSIHRYAALRKTSLAGLRAFEAAFLHGSFAAAAVDLCVSASAVSHAVAALERALGEPLFSRHKKTIYPTHAGSRLYDVVQQAFSRINAEMQAICAQDQGVKTVKMQCAPSLAAIWLMPRLAAFLRHHPGPDLRVRQNRQDEAEICMRRLAREEGIFCGVSSGGAVAAALRLSAEVENAIIVTIICDRGDRYLSSGIYVA